MAFDAKDVEGPSEIVDERREAELRANMSRPLHQKGALIHPLLDRTEGMLDHLAPPDGNPGPRLQSRRHAVEHSLVLQPRDLTTVGGGGERTRSGQAEQAAGLV